MDDMEPNSYEPPHESKGKKSQPLLVLLQLRDKLFGNKAVGCCKWHGSQVRETFRRE